MATAEALRRCPALALVPGEDLAPYRDASARLFAVLSRFGPAERLGMDEVFVDVTQARAQRVLCVFLGGFRGL